MKLFRKYIYIGNDGEEHYDVIDMERDAQRVVRRITDHVSAYNNYMRDHPWMTDGLMKDIFPFGDMLKDENRKSQFKYELGRLMGVYAVPDTIVPVVSLFSLRSNNSTTRTSQ